MLPWSPQSLQLNRQNITLGQTANVQGVLQDSITTEFIIGVEGTVTTVAATPAIEGLPSILQQIYITGPLSGYAPLTPINGLSGPMLCEVAQFIRRNVSYSFGSFGSTGKFGVYIPCTFINNRLAFPWNLSSCLPTNQMGAVNFTCQVATQAQIDTNATATAVISPLTMYVQQNEFLANTIPPLSPLVPAAQLQKGTFKFIPSSLNYVQNTSVQTGAQIQQLFPNGTYLLLLLRSFTTTVAGVATVRQSDGGTAGPIDTSVTTAGLIFQNVNQTPKSATTWYTIRFDNDNNIFDTLVTGNACFQYNNGLEKIFQPSVGPNQIPLKYATTTTGTSAPRIDFVYQQIFDTMNWLNLQ